MKNIKLKIVTLCLLIGSNYNLMSSSVRHFGPSTAVLPKLDPSTQANLSNAAKGIVSTSSTPSQATSPTTVDALVVRKSSTPSATTSLTSTISTSGSTSSSSGAAAGLDSTAISPTPSSTLSSTTSTVSTGATSSMSSSSSPLTIPSSTSTTCPSECIKAPIITGSIYDSVQNIIQAMYATSDSMNKYINDLNIAEPTVSNILAFTVDHQDASVILALKTVVQAIKMALTQIQYAPQESSTWTSYLPWSKNINKEIETELKKNLTAVQSRLKEINPDYSSYYKLGAGAIGTAAIAYLALQNKETLQNIAKTSVGYLPDAATISSYIPKTLVTKYPTINVEWVSRIAKDSVDTAAGTASELTNGMTGDSTIATALMTVPSPR